MALLKLENLHVALEDGTEIVKGVDLEVDVNEVHAVMGPNGSGKSTLSYAIMGHPAYEITEGRLFFDGDDVTATLEKEGVEKFSDSFRQLLDDVKSKRDELATATR